MALDNWITFVTKCSYYSKLAHIASVAVETDMHYLAVTM